VSTGETCSSCFSCSIGFVAGTGRSPFDDTPQASWPISCGWRHAPAQISGSQNISAALTSSSRSQEVVVLRIANDTMDSLRFNIDHGYLEALVRGFRSGILRQADYLNLVQCDSLDGNNYFCLTVSLVVSSASARPAQSVCGRLSCGWFEPVSLMNATSRWSGFVRIHLSYSAYVACMGALLIPLTFTKAAVSPRLNKFSDSTLSKSRIWRISVDQHVELWPLLLSVWLTDLIV
jgi:hypothetical protein